MKKWLQSQFRTQRRRATSLGALELLEDRRMLSIGDTLRTIVVNPTYLGSDFSNRISVALEGTTALVASRSVEPGAPTVIVPTYQQAQLYNVATGELIANLVDPKSLVNPLSSPLGGSVALSQDYAFVSKTTRADNTSEVSSIYRYRSDGTYLGETFNPLDQSLGVEAFAAAGDYLLVSSRNAGPVGGAVFLIRADTGALVQTLTSPSGSAARKFGSSIDISSSRIVIADSRDASSGSPEGAVFVYDLSGNLLNTYDTTDHLDIQNKKFGESVSVVADDVFVTSMQVAEISTPFGPGLSYLQVNSYRDDVKNSIQNSTVNDGFALNQENGFLVKASESSVAIQLLGSPSTIPTQKTYARFPIYFLPRFGYFDSTTVGLGSGSVPRNEHYLIGSQVDATFGSSYDVSGGRLIVSSSKTGTVSILEAYDDFTFDANQSYANGVTQFTLRRSGDDIQIVDTNNPGHILLRRSLDSTSQIRILDRNGSTDNLTIDLSNDFQLPFMLRSMAISVTGGNVNVVGGSQNVATDVQLTGPQSLSIQFDRNDPLAPTLTYSGSGTVTNNQVSSFTAVSLPTSSSSVNLAAIGVSGNSLIQLSDNSSSQKFPSYRFVSPDNTLAISTATSGSVVHIDSVPSSFNGQITVEGNVGNDVVNVATGIRDVSFDGGSGDDRINVSSSNAQIWNITSVNQGVVESINFSNVETLGGGSSSDTFRFDVNGSLAGDIVGAGGVNVLDFSLVNTSALSPLQVNFANQRVPGLLGGTFSSVERAIGPATGFATLIGPDQVSTWKVLSPNAGVLTGPVGVAFEGFDSLSGGSLRDIFSFENSSAAISGKLDGGGDVDFIDYSLRSTSVEVNLQLMTATSVGGGIRSIEAAVGSSASDRMVGLSTETGKWSLRDNFGAGNIAYPSLTFRFDSFETLEAGNSSDSLQSAGPVSNWTVNGVNRGNINQFVSFSGFGNLIGGSTIDIFRIVPGQGSLTGDVDGGAGTSVLDYGTWSTPITVDRKNRTAPGLQNFQSIKKVIGGSKTDRLIGLNSGEIWTLTSESDGQIGGEFSFDSFERLDAGTGQDTLVGSNEDRTWVVSGANTGTVGASSFSGFENLTGGSQQDDFNIEPAGNLAGKIDGGGGLDSLSYQTWTLPVDVEQRLVGVGGNVTASIGYRANGLGNGFTNMESIIGGTDTHDTLTGHSDFLINGVNAGIINPNKTYALTYSGFENLIGAASESSVFRFVTGCFVTGDLNGGLRQGILDYSGYSGLVVEIDLANFTAPLIGGHWSNIVGFTGSDNINRIKATNDDATWIFSDHSNLSRDVNQVIYSPLGHEFDLNRSFNGFSDLQAGDGNDTFYFETLYPKRMVAFPGYKYFYGSIDGGGGDNEVSLNQSQGSNTFGDITLNLQDKTFTPISGTIQNIGRYIRRSSLLEDTFKIIGSDQNNVWNIQSIDARNVYDTSTQQFVTRYMATGSVNGVAFERFDALVGGDADDRFVFDSFVPFKVDPKSGSNTLVLPAYDPDYGTVLFDYDANRDNLVGFQTIEARSKIALSVGDVATTWDIDGHNSGRVANSNTPTDGLNFKGITSILGAPTALDTVRFHDGGQIDGRLSANGTFQPGKDIVDYSAVTTPVTVSVALSLDTIGHTTGVGGQMNGFGVFIGGQSSDTFIADTLNHHWDILGIDRGVINSAAYNGSNYYPFNKDPAQFRFDSFENLVGGNYDDVFRFAPNADITGTIDSQSKVGNFYTTLFYGLAVEPAAAGSPKPVGRTIDLSRYQHIDSVQGSMGTDTLIGPAAASKWSLGRDSRSVTANGWTTYFDLDNGSLLRGQGFADQFVISRLISGRYTNIDGGGGNDTFDATDLISSVSVDMQAQTLTYSPYFPDFGYFAPIVINVAGIEEYLGPNVYGSSVRGRDELATWNIGSSGNQWIYNGQVAFRGFTNLRGGALDDRFSFATSDVYHFGTLDGGGGSNTLDYSAVEYPTPSPFSGIQVDLNPGNITASQVQSVSNIQSVIGSHGDDYITVYDDGVDHFIDGGPHVLGDTLQYVANGNAISRSPGNADHGTVRSGSGATTTFQQIEQFLTDGQQLTGILETSSNLAGGILPQGSSSVDILFSQNLAPGFDPQAFQLFRLTDPEGTGSLQETYVPIRVERVSEDRIRVIRIDGYGDEVALGSGHYRLRVAGDSLFDINGIAVDADGDGTVGGEYVEQFLVPTTKILSAPVASSIATAAAANPILNEIVFSYSGDVNGFVQFPNDGIVLSVADDDGNFQYVPAHLESLADDPFSFRLVPDTLVGYVQAFADGLYRVQLDTTYATDVTGESVDGDGDDEPGGDFIGYFRFANSAPTEITLSNNAVREGRPAESFIGFLNIQDPDPVDSQQTNFQIFTEWPFYAVNYGGSYALVTAEPLSFDQQSTLQTTVTVYDHAGAGFSQTFTIYVIEQDKLEVSRNAIAEELGDSTTVTVRLSVQASDPVRVYLRYDTTASIPDDFIAPHRSGTIRGIAYDDYIDIPANGSFGSLSLTAIDDRVYERFGESITIRVVAADGIASDSALLDSSVQVNITDTDAAPEFDFRPVANGDSNGSPKFEFTKQGQLLGMVGFTSPLQYAPNIGPFVTGEVVEQAGPGIAKLGVDFTHTMSGQSLVPAAIPGLFPSDWSPDLDPLASYRSGLLLSGIPGSPNHGRLTFSIRYHLNPALGITFKAYANDVIEDNGLTIVRTYTILPSDVTAPVSDVSPLPSDATSLSIPISVTGSDPNGPEGAASGVDHYDLYFSTGGAYTKFASVSAAVPSTVFIATSNRTYWFRSIAVDKAGNVESKTALGRMIRTGDFDKPVTQVISAVPNASGLFQLTMSGADLGGGRLVKYDTYVGIDGNTPIKIGSIPASSGSSANITTMAYQGLVDSLSHTYRFYSIGTDSSGNVEVAPGVSDFTVTGSFSVPFTATGIDVQLGAAGRSFVQYLDILFSDPTQLSAWVNADKIKLEKFAIDATDVTPGTGSVVPGYTMQVIGNRLRLNFGAGGLGGSPTSAAGDGFYRIRLDQNSNGTFGDSLDAAFEFHRLYGDVNGDGSVTSADLALINSSFGRTGSNLDGDLDRNGVVNILDKTYFGRIPTGRKLRDWMLSFLDD
jgi:hypothetical protein